MRQTIRALGWIIRILSIITLVLPVTIGFSLMELMDSKAIGFQKPIATFSEAQINYSLPFYINNKGFYDFSDINITVLAVVENKTIGRFSQTYSAIPAHTMFNASFEISLSLREIISRDVDLLFQDSKIDLNISLFFRIAYVIGLGIALNLTMPWGAPLHNVSLTPLQFNTTDQKFSTFLSFENHAQFPINGTLLIEIFNNKSELLGSSLNYIDVRPGEKLQKLLLKILVEDISKITSTCFVRVSFEGIQIFEREEHFNG